MSVEHAHATPAEEEYLQIIYWLMEAELPITGANIARAMRLSPPTVHEMVGRLEHDGYVTRNDDKSLAFTDTGHEQAEADRRPPPPDRAVPDRRGGHRMGRRARGGRAARARDVPAFEQYMIRSVGDAQTCPHGHPISPGNRVPGVPLADVEVGADVEILRFENEAEDLLHYLKQSGMHPGLTGKLAESGDDEVVLKSNGSSVSVTRSVAETVSVRAEPSPPPRTALPEQLVLGKDRYGR